MLEYATIGIEVEFKTINNKARIVSEILSKEDEFVEVDHCWRATCHTDHCNLIEFKSEPIPFADFKNQDLITFRIALGAYLRSAGIPYIYYGFHISIWNFDRSDEIIAAVDILQTTDRIIRPIPEYRPHDNIYEDPFLDMDGTPKHAIIECTMDDVDPKRRYQVVWLPAMKAMRRYFGLTNDVILELLNCGPVQGGGIRIEPRHRIEFVLGWIEPEIEDIVINNILKSVSDKSIPESDPPKEVFKNYSQFWRVGVVYLNKHSFPRMVPRKVSIHPMLSYKISLPFDNL